METKKLLFIAYGNPLRRDDGAGLELARRVQSTIRALNGHPPQFAIDLLELQQLVPELVNEIADPSVALIVFFDCAMQETGDKLQGASCKGQAVEHELQICTLPPTTDPLPPAPFTHHLTPQTLLAMVAALYGPVPPAWLVTIPGDDFELGEGFSKTVIHLFESAPQLAGRVMDGMKLAMEGLQLPKSSIPMPA